MGVITLDQRTAQWHEARMGKLTASIAAACLGLDPWTSRQKAHRMILGTESEKSNPAMRFGVEFEGIARQKYEVETGNVVEETGFWVSDEWPWLGCSPDGLVGDDGCLEIKCPRNLPDAIPLHHRIQCLIQLAVTGRQWCDYWVWTDKGIFLQRIHRAGILGLVRRLKEFYERYVLSGITPERAKPKRRPILER